MSLSTSLSTDLYLRIRDAYDGKNILDTDGWDKEPPSHKGVVVTNHGIASLEIQHFYQLYVELENETEGFEDEEVIMQPPYQSAISIVNEMISLLVDDILSDPNNSTWLITQDGTLYECQDAVIETPPVKPKELPSYIKVVSSRP